MSLLSKFFSKVSKPVVDFTQLDTVEKQVERALMTGITFSETTVPVKEVVLCVEAGSLNVYLVTAQSAELLVKTECLASHWFETLARGDRVIIQVRGLHANYKVVP